MIKIDLSQKLADEAYSHASESFDANPRRAINLALKLGYALVLAVLAVGEAMMETYRMTAAMERMAAVIEREAGCCYGKDECKLRLPPSPENDRLNEIVEAMVGAGCTCKKEGHGGQSC